MRVYVHDSEGKRVVEADEDASLIEVVGVVGDVQVWAEDADEPLSADATVAVLADLSGPKVRLGMLAQDIYLTTGQAFVLRPGDDRTGDASGAGVTHAGLSDDLKPGDRVLLSDGAVELVVRESGNEIRCEVVKSLRKSRIRSGAGVNVPAERLSLPPITAKDRADLQRCVELGVDVIGQSFVRSAEDVEDLRALLGQERIPIVAKIENRSAVEDADRITLVADGIMVARGDLGVEIPLEEIPIVQKELVRRARATGTPSIVATQMLESMISSARPTRAEVSDAANAILDGADGVLLSAETAIGRYPIEAAETPPETQLCTVATRNAASSAEEAKPLVDGVGPSNAAR